MAARQEAQSRWHQVNEFQQRHRVLACVVAVGKKFREDGAGRLAALVAYYSFFAVFPLLLALTTVLGYVFADNARWQEEIAGSAMAQIPVVGDSLLTGTLQGHGIGLALGLLGALWAGTSAVNAAQNAMNSVWNVPHRERSSWWRARLRALLMIVVLGIPVLGSILLSSIEAAASKMAIVGHVLIAAGNLSLNIIVMGLTFRVLTDFRLRRGQILPGAFLAGSLYYGVQTLGTRLVAMRIKDAGDVYGTFATVIGLLTFFYVVAQLMIFAAELNVVISQGLYPRSLFGAEPTEADRAVQQRLIEAAAR